MHDIVQSRMSFCFLFSYQLQFSSISFESDSDFTVATAILKKKPREVSIGERSDNNETIATKGEAGDEDKEDDKSVERSLGDYSSLRAAKKEEENEKKLQSKGEDDEDQRKHRIRKRTNSEKEEQLELERVQNGEEEDATRQSK